MLYFLPMLAYRETPVIELKNDMLDRAGVRLLIKREDLNHEHVSGNKWWKLKYNLQQAISEGHDTILTFGGAYSNHIYSTAFAAEQSGLRSLGIIRGEKVEPLNHTLAAAAGQRMQLEFISREKYRQKTEENFINGLREKFGSFFLIPEGGTNDFAIRGCMEFAKTRLSPLAFDVLMLPVGTGGTIAGIVCGIEGKKEVIGVSVLKGEFLTKDVEELIKNYSGQSYGNWSLLTSYHHGGYAKVTQELLDLVSAMKVKHNLPLDTVYTGKLMWAVLKEVEAGRFSKGTTVLALHTGGLQGNQ